MVKSPVTFNMPGATCSTLVDLNVSVGYLAVSKKWSLRKSLSRSATLVSTEVASMVTSTDDLLMSLSSICTVPLTFVNAPRTVDRTRWRTANCAAEWFGSICHVDVAAAVGNDIAAASAAVKPARTRNWPTVFLLCIGTDNWHLAPVANFLFRTTPRLRADLIEQIRQCLHSRGGHMRELPLVKPAYRRIEPLQALQAGGSNPCFHHAPIVTLALARNQTPLLHAIEQPRHVRVVGDHAFADAAAS